MGRAKPPVVLVVDDEVLHRTEIAETLTLAGYVVLQAANADEAIAVLEQRADVELVFTDVDMPGGMDGVKLALVVAERWPPVRLLVTAAHGQITAQELPPGARFCAKPCPPAVVRATVSELLGRPDQQPN